MWSSEIKMKNWSTNKWLTSMDSLQTRGTCNFSQACLTDSLWGWITASHTPRGCGLACSGQIGFSLPAVASHLGLQDNLFKRWDGSLSLKGAGAVWCGHVMVGHHGGQLSADFPPRWLSVSGLLDFFLDAWVLACAITPFPERVGGLQYLFQNGEDVWFGMVFSRRLDSAVSPC